MVVKRKNYRDIGTGYRSCLQIRSLSFMATLLKKCTPLSFVFILPQIIREHSMQTCTKDQRTLQNQAIGLCINFIECLAHEKVEKYTGKTKSVCSIFLLKRSQGSVYNTFSFQATQLFPSLHYFNTLSFPVFSLL